MRRNLRFLVTLLFLLAGAACTFGRGYIEGAATAVFDQIHARNRIFLLGCGYWPRTQFEQRRDELLWQNYRLAFEAIGGIVPSRFAVQFQRSHNIITWAFLRWRHGPQFIEKIEAHARRDTAASLKSDPAAKSAAPGPKTAPGASKKGSRSII